MIPKDRRLSKQDFDRVFNTGRGVKRDGVRLMWAAGSGKAAVVVAKAVGSTARRNTIKRRWREALGIEVKEGRLPEGVDLVFVVGAEAVGLRGQAVSDRIRELSKAAATVQEPTK